MNDLLLNLIIISVVGIIGIGIYLLVRLGNRMENLAERIKELGEAIKRMI